MIVMILSITVACGLSMAWARLIMMVMMIMIIMTIMFIILLTAPSSARARHGMGKVDNDDYDDNDGDDDDDDDDNEYDLAHLPSSARARHGRGSHRRNGASHSSTGSSLLLQHRPVERVVVLVVQCPEQDPEIKSFEKDQK